MTGGNLFRSWPLSNPPHLLPLLNRNQDAVGRLFFFFPSCPTFDLQVIPHLMGITAIFLRLCHPTLFLTLAAQWNRPFAGFELPSGFVSNLLMDLSFCFPLIPHLMWISPKKGGQRSVVKEIGWKKQEKEVKKFWGQLDSCTNPQLSPLHFKNPPFMGLRSDPQISSKWGVESPFRCC